MKIRTVIYSALATLTLSASAFAVDGEGGAAGASSEPYFEDASTLSFPVSPCNDPANPFKLGCYTNFLVISDLDGDGDLDIVFANGGGYYTPDETDQSDPPKPVSGLEPSTVYMNDGTGAFRDATVTSFGGAMSRLRQVAIADVDGDGDLDLYEPGGYGIDDDKLFIQTAPGVFVDQASMRLPAGLRSRAGSAHFGDLDNDGDMDLVVGDWGVSPRKSPSNTFVYLNDGKGVFSALPASAVPVPIDPLLGRTPIDMDLADIDGDFDLDILVNHRNGQSRIFLNDGKAHFTDGTVGNYPIKKGPYTYNVEACDFDEDGDLDLLLDNAGGNITTDDFFGNISQVLVNDGKGKFTDKSADIISGEPFADDNAVKCADVNGDGHYDLVVASLAVPEKLLLNDGAGHFAFVQDAFPDIIDPTLGIDVADLDGDKKLDVVTGQGEGTPRLNLLYKGAGLSAPDVTPPKFRGVEVPSMALPGVPTVMHLAVTDGYTSETGEHVKEVYLSYKVNGGAAQKLPAKFVGGDLFRVVIPAQPLGTVLEVTPTAIDRVDLKGTAKPITLAFGSLPEIGEGGAGGAAPLPDPVSDSAGAGGLPEPGGGSGPVLGGTGGTGGTGPKGGTGGRVAEAGSVGEAGNGEPSAPGTSEDDGCGCSVVGQPRGGVPLLAGLGLAFMALRRRRGSKK